MADSLGAVKSSVIGHLRGRSFHMMHEFSLGYVNLQFELLTINTAIQTTEPPFQHKLSVATEEFLEQCFDDLLSAQAQVNKYEEEREDDDDVQNFSEQITEAMGEFRDAINLMGSNSEKEKIDACLEAYKKALGGRNIAGKFCKEWKKILKTKVGVLCQVQVQVYLICHTLSTLKRRSK